MNYFEISIALITILLAISYCIFLKLRIKINKANRLKMFAAPLSRRICPPANKIIDVQPLDASPYLKYYLEDEFLKKIIDEEITKEIDNEVIADLKKGTDTSPSYNLKDFPIDIDPCSPDACLAYLKEDKKYFSYLPKYEDYQNGRIQQT